MWLNSWRSTMPTDKTSMTHDEHYIQSINLTPKIYSNRLSFETRHPKRWDFASQVTRTFTTRRYYFIIRWDHYLAFSLALHTANHHISHYEYSSVDFIRTTLHFIFLASHFTDLEFSDPTDRVLFILSLDHVWYWLRLYHWNPWKGVTHTQNLYILFDLLARYLRTFFNRKLLIWTYLDRHA